MKFNASTTHRRDLIVGAVVSVGLHIAIAAVLVLLLIEQEPDDEQPEDQQDEAMEVVVEDEEPPPAPAETMPDAPSPQTEEPREEPQEEEEQPEEQEDEQEDEQPQNRIAVEQKTDDEVPEEADHVSDQANRTDEEMIADTTTLEDVEPTDDPEAQQQEADTDREMATETPDEREEPDIVDPSDVADTEETDEQEESEEEDEQEEQDEPDETQQEDAAQRPEQSREYRNPQEMFAESPRDPSRQGHEAGEQVDPEELFGQDASDAEELLGEPDDSAGQQGESGRQRSGRTLLSNWKENEEAMRAALENFVPNVQTGNHTSVNARQSDHASYIARIHRTIHANWGNGFLPRLANNFSNAHPINDMSLETVVEIVIDAETGEILETVRAEPSGNEMFDAEALNIARNVGVQPDPPESMVSPDGRVYIHWTFWRDQRQCGTFGVQPYRVMDDEERRAVNPD